MSKVGGKTELISVRMTPGQAKSLRALAIKYKLSASEVLRRLVESASRGMAKCANEQVGGSTRHYVRDCLLPTVEARGYWLVLKAQPDNPDADEATQ